MPPKDELESKLNPPFVAPERTTVTFRPRDRGTHKKEYIRADIHEAAVKELAKHKAALEYLYDQELVTRADIHEALAYADAGEI